MKTRLNLIFASFALFAVMAGNALAQEDDPSLDISKRCTICHTKEEFKQKYTADGTRSVYVDIVKFRKSVHGKRGCQECHDDISQIPHGKEVGKVSCIKCHNVANKIGAPVTEKYEQYENSIHGRAAIEGNKEAPHCKDCHGTHEIRRPDDPASLVFKNNIPEDCGKCHKEVLALYKKSIHWKALSQGDSNAPVCTDCHGEHNILKPVENDSTVSSTNIVQTCSRCHADERIMSKYGIQSEQVDTYKESFHGIASEFGYTTVAKCSSCHGFHNILPPDDSDSTVNSRNLAKTCGQSKCHPGATENFTKGRMHVSANKKESGKIYWIKTAFTWLTIFVMAGLVGHIVLDMFNKIKEKRKENEHHNKSAK